MGSNPTSIEWSLEDDQGVPNRVQMYFAYDALTETVDALENAFIYYGGLIDPLVDGQIVGGQITIPLQPDAGWKTAPVSPGNNCNQVMTLNFDNAGNGKAVPVLLPSYKESILVAKRPNIGATPLSTFIAAVIAGYITEAFPNSDAFGDITALRNAFLGTRKLKSNKAATIVKA
jgi:hypothetical protein